MNYLTDSLKDKHMEFELIKLCKDMINALTKDNYELIKRFVKLEEEFEKNLPTPEKMVEVQPILPGVGKIPKGGKEHKPVIEQGDLPWETQDENKHQKNKTEKKEIKVSFDDLPF